MLIIGPHISVARGFTRAAKDIIEMEGNTFQFFSRNPRGSNYKRYDEKDINEFQRLRKEYKFGPIQAHAPYTMNLGSADKKVYKFAKEVIKEDIERMDNLGIEYICFHPGNHVGNGTDIAIEQGQDITKKINALYILSLYVTFLNTSGINTATITASIITIGV